MSGAKLPAMKVIADICVIPNTGRTSVREEVALAHRILAETGLKVHLHGYGTNVEGDYDTIFAALKKVHETLHAGGAAPPAPPPPPGARPASRPPSGWDRARTRTRASMTRSRPCAASWGADGGFGGL